MYKIGALILSIFAFSNLFAQTSIDVSKQFPQLLEFYRDLHTHPELSFKESRTAAKLAGEMRRLGFEVTEQFGGSTAIVAVYKNGTGPTLLVRTDMDGLPVIEETDLPYASKQMTTDNSGKTVGVMHACGHDVHMSVWLGTARMLLQMKQQWKGTLVFIGQPAEEISGGAKQMLGSGLFEKFPRPDYALGLHVNATLASNQIGICRGYAMANVDMVDITVYGKGGHGAYPHNTTDPVVLAAKLVLDLQTIVSREINPLESAVLTVGAINGGAIGNVIPNEVVLKLTLRSYTDEVRQALLDKIAQRCKGLGLAAGLPEDLYPKVTLRDESTPALYNTPELTDRLRPVIEQQLGAGSTVDVPPSMVGEDFGRYGRVEPKIPSLMIWLGTIEPTRAAAAAKGDIALPALHSSKYAPSPEAAITTGVRAMTAAALDLLK
mgnify:CR=1 FL=1